MQEICIGFEMSLSQKNPKKKICTLCYGTGSIRQPNGVKVPVQKVVGVSILNIGKICVEQ